MCCLFSQINSSSKRQNHQTEFPTVGPFIVQGGGHGGGLQAVVHAPGGAIATGRLVLAEERANVGTFQAGLDDTN